MDFLLEFMAKHIIDMFCTFEENIGSCMHTAAKLSMDWVLQDERQTTTTSSAKSPTDAYNKIGILDICDMHWARRSRRGNKYISPPGCSYIMGFKAAYTIGYIIYTNTRRMCMLHFERVVKEGTENYGALGTILSTSLWKPWSLLLMSIFTFM